MIPRRPANPGWVDLFLEYLLVAVHIAGGVVLGGMLIGVIGFAMWFMPPLGWTLAAVFVIPATVAIVMAGREQRRLSTEKRKQKFIGMVMGAK